MEKSAAYLQSRYQQHVQIEVLYESDERLKLDITGADISLVNALRRIILAEVPTLAIDLVSIYDNSTVLQDEIIAHRLGLLPIDSSRINDYVYAEECNCSQGCNKCSVKYSIDIKAGPDQPLKVTHLDINGDIDAPGFNVFNSKAYNVTCEHMDERKKAILLFIIPPGGEFRAEMKATKGIGKIHAKWNPACTATFKCKCNIFINEELQRKVPNSVKAELLLMNPRGLLRLQNSLSEVIVTDYNTALLDSGSTSYDLVVENPELYEYNNDLSTKLKELGFSDYVTVQIIPNSFYFYIEAAGQLTARQIFFSAIAELDKKLTTIMNDFLKHPTTMGVIGSSSNATFQID